MSLFSESLGQSRRSNPFTIESEEARAVETSGRLVQVLQNLPDRIPILLHFQNPSDAILIVVRPHSPKS